MRNVVDQVLAGAALLILSPLFLAIIVAIKWEDGWKAPVFFAQKRVGIQKRHFQLYKFRSMKLDTPHDTPTHLLADPEQYITKAGKFLRKTSLDELPQLWNIARGDMAVIGPRPALWNQYDLNEERDRYGVHQVKPGLTGWAQIHGRDELEIPQKAKLDGYYLEHLGPMIDLKCFFGTFVSVLKSEGVVEGGTGRIQEKKHAVKQKKVILVANVAKEHILKFHVPTIRMLKEKGWCVDVACSGNEKIPFCDHQFSMYYKRNPFSIGTIKGIFQLRKILKKEQYDIVSCHTPTGGIVARIASIGIKKKPYVIYTAHGFHFFKGAPIINWLIYFPVEWILSYCTDEIVVINKEDYLNATKYHLGMKKLTWIPGMGVDRNRFSVQLSDAEKAELKKELEIEDGEFVYTYVAEILRNKNQKLLLEALKLVREKTGKGVLLLIGPIHDNGECQKLANDLGIAEYVHFTGWRNDIERIFNITDVCVASSIREGLGLNLIEAQFSGVPVIASENRGHKDIIKDRKNGFLVNCYDASVFAQVMILLQQDADMREKIRLAGFVSSDAYSREKSLKAIWQIYKKQR